MELQTHERRTRQLNQLNTALALLIAFVLLLGYQYVSGRQQLTTELKTEGAIIGATSAAALVFNDRQAAQEILGATRLSSQIIGGALYRDDGHLLAFVNDPQQIFPALLPAPVEGKPVLQSAVSLPLFHHLIRQEIFQERTRVGSLLLLVTYESLYVKMLEYLVGLLIIGTFALLLTQRFTAGLRRKMALTEEQLEQMALYDPL